MGQLYDFSDRLKNMTGNAIRDIFKLLATPEIISFAGGMPAGDVFPSEIMADIAKKVLTDNPVGVLQYGATEGYKPFVDTAIEFVKRAGIHCTPDELQVISGGQQGIDLTSKALLNKGDVVLVENPTYLAALQIFNTYEADIKVIQTDDEGVIPADLEEKIKKHSPKLVYLIPTFQNPTGRTLTLERRKQIIQIINKYNIVLLEDDPYRDLRYSGNPIPSLKSLDTAGRVVYLCSFSKIISPGLRCGVAIADKELLRKITIGKQATDVHTNSLSQAIISEYINMGLLPAHIEHSNKVHGERMRHMLDEIGRYFPGNLSYTKPEGGLFIWVELSSEIDATALMSKAISKNVAFIPGTHFFADNSGKNTMRLNFSNSSLDRITTGIKALGELLTEYK